jgi:hypothetical protein
MWLASRQTPPLELTAAVPSSAVATIRTFRQRERSRRGCRRVGDLPASIRNEGVRCQVGVRTEALVLTRRVLSLGPPPPCVIAPSTCRTRGRRIQGWLASARPDGLVFSAATVALALHVIVDSFFAPEPGTAPGDHLLRGAASLAVLLIAAVVYARLPGGGRAALALVFGALALEGAALAVVDARAVGPRGEDWTGFLLAPLGVLLVGSAITLLWRSRKPGRHRYLRRAAIVAAATLAAYWLVVPVAIAILATHRPRADVAPAELGRPTRS